MLRFSRLGVYGFVSLLLVLTACQVAGPAIDDETPDDLKQLEAQIVEMIGNAPATSVNQCRVIGFGDKPCGGPWRYLVYSTSATDSTVLQTLVNRYNTLDADRNRREGLVSDCRYESPPVLVVVEGQCQAD